MLMFGDADRGAAPDREIARIRAAMKDAEAAARLKSVTGSIAGIDEGPATAPSRATNRPLVVFAQTNDQRP